VTHRAGSPGSAEQHNSSIFDQAKGVESRRGNQRFRNAKCLIYQRFDKASPRLLSRMPRLLDVGA